MKPKTIRILLSIFSLLLIVGCAQAEPEAAEPAAQPVTAQNTAPSDAPVDQPVPQTQSDQPNTAMPAAVTGTAPTATPATQERTYKGRRVITLSSEDVQATAAAPTLTPTPTPNIEATAEAVAQAELEQAMKTSPRFDESDQLQATYQSMNLEAFALNPNISYYDRPIPEEKPFEEYWQHPYIHVFPDMMTFTNSRAGTEGSQPETFKYSYYTAYDLRIASPHTRKEYTIESFIHQPWFEPWPQATIGYSDYKTGESGSLKPEGTFGPYIQIGTPYFGKDSTREVLANTVSQLIQSALKPGATEIDPKYFLTDSAPEEVFTPPTPRKLPPTCISLG